jgi:hypothetical protein
MQPHPVRAYAKCVPFATRTIRCIGDGAHLNLGEIAFRGGMVDRSHSPTRGGDHEDGEDKQERAGGDLGKWLDESLVDDAEDDKHIEEWPATYIGRCVL